MKNSPKGLPPRVAARQDPSSWSMDELLTLREAAALHFSDGLFSSRKLHRARLAGLLGTVTVNGKIFTSRRAIDEMCRCSRNSAVPVEVADAPELSFDELVRAKVAAKVKAGVLPPKK
jgi:hypothetical protein